jgi:HPt (histidine-containing phosphotransfer) domain-containing protein
MTLTGLTAKSKALNDLRQAVEALRPYLTTPDQQAALFLIDEAAARLHDPVPAGPTGLSDFDASRLSHLMTLTGPDLAVELLARLTEDLTSTEAQLDLGVASADWKRLREGSHVLISLSGSVGALSLQAMAENLNAIAHRQDRDALDALMPPLSGELASLIRLIRATQPPTKGM